MPDHGHDASAGAADPRVEDARLEEIVAGGPLGAFAVAGVATFVVVAIFVAFYFVFYLPRGMIQ